MNPRILAFMAFFALLFAFYGCSSAAPQEATDSPAIMEFSNEDVLEFQSAPSPVKAGDYLASIPSPTPARAAVSADTSADTSTDLSTPLSTATPRPGYLLTEVRDEKGYVKAGGVNMREGPGTSYDIVDVVDSRTTLIITGKTEEWYRVEIGDTAGFILKEFIGVGAIPTPTPTPKPKSSSSSSSSSKTNVKQGEKGDYSDDDIYLVARLIYAEGKNQTSESFVAMANVLYNRVKSKKFGGTVKQEVYRKNQFTVVDDSGFETLKPSSSALRAARQVFNEGKRSLPDGVMYFRSAKKGTSWSSSRKYYATIGGNCYFY